MATVTTSQAEQLLAGRVICPRCGAALLASSPQCRYCKQLLAAPAAAATPVETPTVFEVVVYGKPITQGSMKRGRGGGLIHSNEDLHPWRQAIEDALREKYWHPGWEPITQAVSADLIVTVPRPKSAPKNTVTYPTSHSTGDSDKYPRAVCDAASPKPPLIETRRRPGPHQERPQRQQAPLPAAGRRLPGSRVGDWAGQDLPAASSHPPGCFRGTGHQG